MLDNQVVTQPIINFVENPDGIDGRTGAQISGNFTISSAQDLAEFLRIGALPINLQLESQSTVSATLGQQALDQGLRAGVIGLILVVCFLIAYYRLLGVIATVGLAVYGVIFFALVKLIPITLTLPGIAGLILTIGVAADANIVIFERIKEEARAGRSTLSAIGQGYRKGIATIVDANVITLFTAFILFVLATAGVKGFAFTLGRRHDRLAAHRGAVHPGDPRLAGPLAAPALAARAGRRASNGCAGASTSRAPAAGSSRSPGRSWRSARSRSPPSSSTWGSTSRPGRRSPRASSRTASVDDVRTALDRRQRHQRVERRDPDGREPEAGPERDRDPGQDPGRRGQQRPSRTRSSRASGCAAEARASTATSVGPTFGAQVARSAVIAIVFSLLVISAYVAIRFEAKYAIPVIIALIHDILITGGVYSLTGREVTSGTVAAFLTILGYSMYDTVIVFDRIRENVPRMPRAAFSQIANKSMSEVLTRSLITGLSTVFLITVLFIFGGATLKDFAFAMGVGVLSGTYSSIFIATPVLTHWKEREPAYRARRGRLIEEMGRVPTFPEDNVVAKVGADGEPAPAAAPRRASRRAARRRARPVEPEPASRPSSRQPRRARDRRRWRRGRATRRPSPSRWPPARPASRPRPARSERQRKRRQQRRRRKHGRNR